MVTSLLVGFLLVDFLLAIFGFALSFSVFRHPPFIFGSEVGCDWSVVGVEFAPSLEFMKDKLYEMIEPNMLFCGAFIGFSTKIGILPEVLLSC